MDPFGHNTCESKLSVLKNDCNEVINERKPNCFDLPISGTHCEMSCLIQLP